MTPNAPPSPKVQGVNAWLTLLMLAALALVTIGMLLLSEATTGVGLIAGGCFVGICTRVLQAGAHHKAIMRSGSGS